MNDTNQKSTNDKFRDKAIAVDQQIKNLIREAKQNKVNVKNGREALRWLATKAKAIKTGSTDFMRSRNSNEYRSSSQLQIGNMYVFGYDPKWKKKLPYYDRFPCIFLVGIQSNGYLLGINLHYLPHSYRLIIMEELYRLENNARLTKNKKLELTWNKLKAFRNFPLVIPTVKLYIPSHLRSLLIKVPYEEWPIVSMLPIQKFEKKSGMEVWNESANIARKAGHKPKR